MSLTDPGSLSPEQIASEWANAPIFSQPAQPLMVEPFHQPVRWVDVTAEKVLNMQPTIKIRLKTDMPVAKPGGLHTYAASAGEEIEVDRITAETLIAEGKAEHVDGPKSLEDRIAAGTVTANEMSPDYGTGPHRDAVQDANAKDKEKELHGQAKAGNKGK